MPKMFLVFSHKLTEDQIKDAIENLNVNEFIYLPKELQEVWSNIPPDIEDIKSHINPIIEFLRKKANKGDYVLVQGDFGATYLIVSWALKEGLIPIYSTTKRIVKDIYNENGKIETIRIFKHCKFRKYQKY